MNRLRVSPHSRIPALLLTFILLAGASLTAFAAGKKKKEIAPSYAWTTSLPLGDMTPADMDTSYIDYSLRFIPALINDARATTGNMGGPGRDMVWHTRSKAENFYFFDPLTYLIPPLNSFKFYNTRIPMTLMSYNFGGGSDNGQDDLKGIFSGNVNKQIQVGAYLDYLYSKGSYASQAAKDFTYGFSGSYMGDRYKMQASFFNFNLLNKENGGITDDRYITDPEAIQGMGVTSVNAKNIPVNLNNAHTRVRGNDFFISNRYSLGYTHVERADTDTIERKTFIPLTDLILNLQYQTGSHLFQNSPSAEDTKDFFPATYYTTDHTYDRTTYRHFLVTAGIGLLEGCHKWAKMGVTAFVSYDYSRYGLPTYGETPAHPADPLPDGWPTADRMSRNKIIVGGQLRSTKGKYINYDVTGQIALSGAPGEFDVNGHVTGSVPLLGDTLGITAYGRVANSEPSPLMLTYRSNHWWWHNNFSNTQSFRVGGILNFRKTGTRLDIGTETLTNYVYFDNRALPAQASGATQVFWAALDQRLHLGPVHWDNRITYQATSDEHVIPLPALTVNSNLYALFTIARVLRIQAGLDVNYYTRYRAPGYRPETMAFYNQSQVLLGNYPVANVYLNMKLSRATFYVMMSHVNQGMFSNDYFSMPGYPINPRRFQAGICVNFAN
ncbi:MAG: putative porin [Candidatus Amulumruptor caecigallinarius]|nr:putative porin [Candidatus Amulumruptor caecigallinarius]MCM1396758.1 putative porin [Candidatus Amulumruptor caecigallinarius]MCM1453184.1 putative porin [bacterium]